MCVGSPPQKPEKGRFLLFLALFLKILVVVDAQQGRSNYRTYIERGDIDVIPRDERLLVMKRFRVCVALPGQGFFMPVFVKRKKNVELLWGRSSPVPLFHSTVDSPHSAHILAATALTVHECSF